MLYFVLDKPLTTKGVLPPDFKVEAVTGDRKALRGGAYDPSYFVCRVDLKAETQAAVLAGAACAHAEANGEAPHPPYYIATDAGPHHHPRYDVIEAPRVGQPVSYGMNGDSYPDGYITSVGDGVKMIIKTDTGSTYYRHKNTGTWLKQGGSWCLSIGHHDERNPSF